MDNIIVVPSYWSKEGFPEIYDHPTLLEAKNNETLSRLLASLRRLNGSFKVIIIGVVTNEELEQEVWHEIKEIVESFPDLNVSHFHNLHLRELRRQLEKMGIAKKLTKRLSMEGYGNVRNICLLIPYIMGAEIIILLDDDEIVMDKNFIKRAREYVGNQLQGKMVGGIAGVYIEKPVQKTFKRREWWERFWEKRKCMQQVLNNLNSGKRLKRTPLALGGNMVIHRALATEVPFDPFIYRGEDTDYLWNAKHFGFEFLYDTRLRIVHRPPVHRTPRWEQIRRDLKRFIYQREKVKLLKIPQSSLSQYPGYFLRKDLRVRGFLTCLLLALDCLIRKHPDDSKNALYTAIKVLFWGRDAKNKVKSYLKFQLDWVCLMETLAQKEIEIVKLIS
ncbi:MAG: glycosyltransferase family 2 protein [Candidatus Heimdallarchaeota archaeon]